MVPRLLGQLGPLSELAGIATLDLESQGWCWGKIVGKWHSGAYLLKHRCRLTSQMSSLYLWWLTISYLPFLGFNLGIPSDWARGQMFGLQTVVGNPGSMQPITLLPLGDGSGDDVAFEPPPAVYIQISGATTFDDVVASNEVIVASAIQINKGTNQLGASTMLEGVTSQRWDQTSPGWCWMGKQGAAMVVAAEGGPQGNLEWMLPAHQDTEGIIGWTNLAVLWPTISIWTPGFSLPQLPSFLLFVWLTEMQ